VVGGAGTEISLKSAKQGGAGERGCVHWEQVFHWQRSRERREGRVGKEQIYEMQRRPSSRSGYVACPRPSSAWFCSLRYCMSSWSRAGTPRNHTEEKGTKSVKKNKKGAQREVLHVVRGPGLAHHRNRRKQGKRHKKIRRVEGDQLGTACYSSWYRTGTPQEPQQRSKERRRHRQRYCIPLLLQGLEQTAPPQMCTRGSKSATAMPPGVLYTRIKKSHQRHRDTPAAQRRDGHGTMFCPGGVFL